MMATYLPDQACQDCDVLKTCNSVACKSPPAFVKLNETAETSLKLKSVETGLTKPNKYLFEHLLGAALRQTKAVKWAVDKFIFNVSLIEFILI